MRPLQDHTTINDAQTHNAGRQADRLVDKTLRERAFRPDLNGSDGVDEVVHGLDEADVQTGGRTAEMERKGGCTSRRSPWSR